MQFKRKAIFLEAFFHSSAWLFLAITAYLVFDSSKKYFEKGQLDFFVLTDAMGSLGSLTLDGSADSRGSELWIVSSLLTVLEFIPVVLIAFICTIWMFSISAKIGKPVHRQQRLPHS